MKVRVVASVAAAVAVSFAVGVIVASDAQKNLTDPEVGLTEAQRRAAHAEGAREFWTRYAAWVDQENRRGIDPRSYTVRRALASVAAPAPTLVEATRQAELIVEGTVLSVTFRSTADVAVTVSISDTLKGVARESVQVILPNALMPEHEWSGAAIVEVEAMPMLYPGDNVVLFLVRDPNYEGSFDVQAWTGTYWPKAAETVAVNGNPFSPAVGKLGSARFREAIWEALSLPSG